MKRRIYYVLALAILPFASCNQNDLKLINDIARIQFSSPIAIYTTAYSTMDTTKTYTFFYNAETIRQDTVFFDIYTSGNISEKDRPFSLQQVQVKGAANAIPGTDYKAFTDPTIKSAYIIKAGQAHATVPIILLRSISQKTTILTLKITITANENFQLGEESCLWRKVIFTDSVSKPASWRDNL